MENRRIFNLKTIMVLLGIIIFTCGAFIKTEIDYGKEYEENKGFTFREYALAYSDTLSVLQYVEDANFKDTNRALYEQRKALGDREAAIGKEVFKNINEQGKYADNYKSVIEGKIEEASSLIVLPIFSDKNSYGYHNILKTRYDLKKLTDIEIGVSNTNAVDRFFSFSLTKYALILMMIITVIRMKINEQGMATLAFSAKYGRIKLGIRRIAIVILSGIVYSAILAGLLLAIAFIRYGGISCVGELIQSNPNYQFNTIVITYGQYIIYYILCLGIGCAICGLLLWNINVRIKSKNVCFFAIGVLLVVEQILYNGLLDNFVLNILRWCNIFTLLDANELLGNYLNIGFGSFIIGRDELVTGFTVVFAVALIVLFMRYSTKRILDSRAIKWKLVKKVIYKIRSFTARSHVIFKENYKQLIILNGFIIIGIYVVCLFNINPGIGTLYEEDYELEMLKYYSEVKGNAYEATDKYIEGLKTELNGYEEKLALLDEKMEANKRKPIEDNMDIINQTISHIEEQAGIVKVKNSSGIDARIVNEKELTNRYGMRGARFLVLNYLAAIGVAILLLFANFSIERDAKMTPILRVSKKGRNGYLLRKYTLASILMLCMQAIMLYVSNYRLGNVFGVNSYEWDASIKSIEFFNDVPLDISFKTLEIGRIVIYSIITLMISYVVIALSLKYNKEVVLVISIVAMILPLLVYALLLNSIMVEFELIIMGTVAMFTILAGIMSIIYVRNRWVG